MTAVFICCYLTLSIGALFLLWKVRMLPAGRTTTVVRIGLAFSAYFGLLKACLLSPALPWAAHLIGTGAGFWYLVGPLVFMTVWVLVEPRASIKRVHGLHLFPLVWMLPGLLPFFALPAPDKVALFEASLVRPARVNGQSLLHVAIILAYVGAAVHVVRQRWTRPSAAILKITATCLALIGCVLIVETGVALVGVRRFLLGNITAILVMALFLDTNFNAFVNGYRVREAQRLLRDPAAQHLTLLSIGHDAGFNSKSSFNRVFKDVVGMPPSEYRAKNSPEYSPRQA